MSDLNLDASLEAVKKNKKKQTSIVGSQDRQVTSHNNILLQSRILAIAKCSDEYIVATCIVGLKHLPQSVADVTRLLQFQLCTVLPLTRVTFC